QGRLEEQLRSAADDLGQGRLFAAGQAEKNARDRLYDLASLVAPVEDSATKLRKAAEKLDKAIAEEKQIIGQTHALAARIPAGDESYVQVEERQGDNVEL